MQTFPADISILGAGTWGVALAAALAGAGHRITVWSAFEAEAESLSRDRTHPRLPGLTLDRSIRFTSDEQEAAKNADTLLFVVPSPFIRSTAERFRPCISDGQLLACATKGLEDGTLLTMTGVLRQVLGAGRSVVALSGPTHAEEVALGMPTLIVSACGDISAAKTVQQLFAGTCIRPYTSTDETGVELCGALKNIEALACGIAAGLGYGDNTRAAIMTRGIAEISNLGRAMNCSEQTFAGLSGIGDLIVTATSRHSRNNRFGMLIGQGMAPDEALKEIGMVVEGVNALPAALSLSRKYKVEMPIMDAVNAILQGRVTPEEAVRSLFARELKHESREEPARALWEEKELLNP